MHRVSIDLRRLRCFLAVADELHFRRAARRLGMSQPPLSAAIRSLEEDLGARLFERSTRSVRITGAGLLLKERGERLVADLEQLERQVRLAAAGHLGRLAVGFVGIATHMGLPAVLRSFSRSEPEVDLHLEELPSPALLEQVRSGRLDLGYVRGIEPPAGGLSSRAFASEPYVLAVPEGHPLQSRKLVALEDLDGEALLFFPRSFSPPIHDALLRALHEASVRPRLVQEARSLQAEMALVAAGIGACLVARSAASQPREGVSFLPLAPGLPPVSVFEVWQPESGNEVLERFLRASGSPS